MRVRVVILLLIVAASLAAVAVVAVRMLAGDREALVRRFTDERRYQLLEARAEVEADFAGFSEDLELAQRLWHSADSDEDRARELSVIVAVSREYHQAEVWDASGVRVSRIAPDELGAVDVPGLAAAIATTVAEARTAREGKVVVSRPLGGDSGRGLRVFARGAGPPGGRTVVALVVDTGPAFSKLRILAADPDTRMVVLGGRGVPAPATDPVLAAIISELDTARTRLPRFAAAVDRMRAREAAVVRIAPVEAGELGMGDAEVIALIQPIRVEDGEPWSIALLSSTAAMRHRERASRLRMVSVVAVIVLILGGLSGFVILSARRTVALRERLRHAAELAEVRERAEQQLVRSEKLATVGQIAAGIAHEIGTPLGVARGRAEYMRGKVTAEDPHARTYATIMEQIDHVSRTIRALLDFSRLEPAIAAAP
ncbi:MAG TPA: histidine kinase dimerization/phospho-acceptor domain-containing protein, partial [Kofleriaceae bacterium]|nr:histidine kinase dimerization/phospho-acceptor domain-containing protein [Kofleriaceae bacterium]